jgi:hypothetical protein
VTRALEIVKLVVCAASAGVAIAQQARPPARQTFSDLTLCATVTEMLLVALRSLAKHNAISKTGTTGMPNGRLNRHFCDKKLPLESFRRMILLRSVAIDGGQDGKDPDSKRLSSLRGVKPRLDVIGAIFWRYIRQRYAMGREPHFPGVRLWHWRGSRLVPIPGIS